MVYIKKFIKGEEVIYKGELCIYMGKHPYMDDVCIVQGKSETNKSYVYIKRITPVKGITNKDVVYILDKDY